MKLSKFPIIYWFPFLLGALFFFQMVPPAFSYGNDSLIKGLQSISLGEQGLQKEEYLYFLKEKDPDYKYFPIDYPLYHIQISGKHLGPFPIFFSAQTVLLTQIFPYSALPVFSFFSLMAALVYLKNAWKLSFPILYFTFFCTSIPLLFLEYSENLYFVLLLVIGATLVLQRRDEKLFLTLGGICIGLSTFYRLESVLFFPFLWLSFFFRFRKEDSILTKLILLGSGFSLILGIFLALNVHLYGHFLGPRYLVDQSGFQKGFKDKLYLFQALWIVGKWNEYWKPGLLGLTPLFLLPVFSYFRKKNLDWSIEAKSYFEASLGFFLLAPFFSPHDGQWTWGARYLNLCIFPFCIALDQEWKAYKEKTKKNSLVQWKSFILICLVGFSLGLLLLGVKITSFSAKILKQVQTHLEELPEPSVKIFSSGIVALHSGLGVLQNQSLLLKDKQGLDWFIALKRKETVCLVQSPLLETALPQKIDGTEPIWFQFRNLFLQKYPSATPKSLWGGKLETFCSPPLP